jgi:hypothetical protein
MLLEGGSVRATCHIPPNVRNILTVARIPPRFWIVVAVLSGASHIYVYAPTGNTDADLWRKL